MLGKSLKVKDSLSIIIIVKNRQRHLENTLKSIEANSPYFKEVILVHMNQNTQPELENLVNYSIEQLSINSSSEELPLAKARNLGASVATSATLLFLDVDCILDSNACLEYLKACRNNPLNIYMSKCLYLESPVLNLQMLPNIPRHEHIKRTVKTTPKWQLFWSLSFVINKEWFQRLGKFDENFLNYGGEDTELSYRNYLNKGSLIWVPDSVVYHQPHESNELPIHHIKSVINNVNYFYKKHGFYIMEDWIEGFIKRDMIKKENGVFSVL